MRKGLYKVSSILAILCSLNVVLGISAIWLSTPKDAAEILLDSTSIESFIDGSYKITKQLHVKVHTPAAAESFRYYSVYFDGSSEVLELSATVQGSSDKKPKKIKRKDIYNRDYNDYMSVATDGHFRELKLDMPSSYPAVMQFYSVKRLNSAVALPLEFWMPQKHVKIKRGELILIDRSNNIRIKIIDPDSLILISKIGDSTTMRVENLVHDENRYKYSGILDKGPAICLAPSVAALEGVTGNFDSWQGIGRWIDELVETREELPLRAIQDVRTLVEGVDDLNTRIALVYDYVQQRSHYVSIQLGIGGFQPMLPEDVHANGYGDCKALTNYTRLLLKAIDIPSRYCIIGVNDREILFKDFPSLNQANHAMLAVPLDRDTLWLECTSQQTPAGYIGNRASGRMALMLDGENTKLVRTSFASPEDNLINRRSEISIGTDGSANLVQTQLLQGNALATAISLTNSNTSLQDRIVRAPFSVTLENLATEFLLPSKTVNPTATASLTAYIPVFTKRLDDVLILPAFSLFKPNKALSELTKAKEYFYYPNSESYTDTLNYIAPEGYQFSSQSVENEFKSSLGSYYLSAKTTLKGLTVVRHLSVKKTKLDNSSFFEAKVFAEQVLRADRSSFSIKKE